MKLFLKIQLLVYYFGVISCSPSTVNLQDGIIEISILNKKIEIPSDETVACSDTIYIIIENGTRDNYVFAFEDSVIIFYDHVIGEDYEFITDPFEGVAIKFLDEESLALNIERIAGFNPEGFEKETNFFPKSHLKKVKSNQSITLKAILKFPNRNYHGSYIQKVENLQLAKFVEIIFSPPKEKTLNYINKNKVVIGKSDKILDITQRFILETKVKSY